MIHGQPSRQSGSADGLAATGGRRFSVGAGPLPPLCKPRFGPGFGMSVAQPGHQVVEVFCRCRGAVLVRSFMASTWSCGVCFRRDRYGRLFVFGEDGVLREVPAGEIVDDARGA